MASTRSSLWHQPDFLKLWAGQTISIFGSGITGYALPLTALLVLGAGASDMGWLYAVESAPVLLFGMFAGVWVDRFRRRPLLIGADLGRAGLLACIPLLAWLSALRMEHLYIVAAATGVLTLVFDVAHRSFVPDLVGRDRVLEANSRFATVEAVAEIGTPGLTGALVQVIAAPTAILLDAASFVVSAVCVLGIRQPEPPRAPTSERQHVWSDIAEGLRAVGANATLRALAGSEALRNFFGSFLATLYLLFGLRELGLSPVLVGITVGVGGVSNLLGTLVVQRATHRFGSGRTIVSAVLVGCLTPLLIAIAPGRPVEGFVLLLVAQALDFIHPLYNVNTLTLRQVITADDLLGRVNATFHVLVRGVFPIGALASGMLGDAIGLRPTLLVAAAGFVISAVLLTRSPMEHKL